MLIKCDSTERYRKYSKCSCVSYRFLGLTSQPSRHLMYVVESPGEISVFSGSWAQKVNLRQSKKISANSPKEKQFCDCSILPPPPSAYFFCVSPAFTRILRTSRIGLVGFGSQFQKDFLKFFQTEFQVSASPSQVRRIFNRSPISSSVNTRKVLVRFRPTMPSWLKKGQNDRALIGKYSGFSTFQINVWTQKGSRCCTYTST